MSRLDKMQMPRNTPEEVYNAFMMDGIDEWERTLNILRKEVEDGIYESLEEAVAEYKLRRERSLKK